MRLQSVKSHVATYSRADIDAVIDQSRGRHERAKATLQSIGHTILESLRVLQASERKLRDLESRPVMTFRLE
jgi:molybdenum-dependent DNA-binding transcriptional regulator ModE